jgi:thymidylate synthase
LDAGLTEIESDLASIEGDGRPAHDAIASLLIAGKKNLRQLAVVVGSVKNENVRSVVVIAVQLGIDEILVCEVPCIVAAQFEVAKNQVS